MHRVVLVGSEMRSAAPAIQGGGQANQEAPAAGLSTANYTVLPTNRRRLSNVAG